eukprot:TRINITY_DN3294_c0_g1_i2.p1 TRINITY_DN3294_c0_g1~~TRINITY_DN3294_c0_g1_i2.p1  ORF type:complete len:270 (-),score=52.21 TRINITY_DN3294_c0_g1_i2:128-937(-)
MQLWDIRQLSSSFLVDRNTSSKAEKLLEYESMPHGKIIGGYFNSDGSKIATTSSGFYPMLYNVSERYPTSIFYSKNYINECTLKSVIFGFNDQYILSGSDDFRIYAWRIMEPGDDTSFINTVTNEILEENTEPNRKKPKTPILPSFLREYSPIVDVVPKATCVMTGHRSIVNNIAVHKKYPILCSSGVEKIVKLWSPYPMFPGITKTPPDRVAIRGRLSYNSLDLEEEESSESMYESFRTLSFFDSLRHFTQLYNESSSEENSDEYFWV